MQRFKFFLKCFMCTVLIVANAIASLTILNNIITGNAQARPLNILSIIIYMAFAFMWVHGFYHLIMYKTVFGGCDNNGKKGG